MDITIVADDLTLGQAEFWGEFTGRTIMELKDILEDAENRMTAKDLVALASMSINPDDPTAALEQVRSTKVIELNQES